MEASNHTTDHPSVLIVGAGPTGLTLALSLAQQGIPIRIVDKNVAPIPGQRGAGIHILEVLESLGLSAPVQQFSIAVSKLRIYKVPGGVDVLKDIVMFPNVDPTPDRPLPTARFLGQNHRESILTTAIQERGANVDRGVEFISLEQTDDLVKVTSAHGPENLEEATFQYVIGADGCKGLVRNAIGLPFVGETHEDKQVVFGDFYLSGLSSDYLHTWGAGIMNGAFARGTETPGLFSVVIGGDIQEYIASEDKLASARMLFKAAIGGREDVQIVDVVWQGIYRVFLAGDAAHVHSPTGGQGLNTGIQDAYNLGWKLALVLKGQAPPTLLESYTAERVPVVSEMLSITTDLFKKTVNLNTGEDPNAKTVLERGGVLSQFGVNYRTSDIVLDDGDLVDPVGPYGGAEAGDVRAGDRAPDAPGLVLFGGGDRSSKGLFEILDLYPAELVHVVIVQSASVDAGLSDDGGGVALYQDSDGHADRSYRSSDGSGKLFVIRPDGYVGGRLTSFDGVATYFKRIFG